MAELPPESERLFAVEPTRFVSERQRLVRELRAAGRADEADAVAGMKKPSAVVLAVNRAARDRPKAASAAAAAAEAVEKTQLRGDPEAFRTALSELDRALDLLGEVAIAHVGRAGRPPTDAMRRRVHELLRRAVADPETRAALGRGVLAEEQDAAGFSPFAGGAERHPGRARGRTTQARAKRQEAKRRARADALRNELARAEEALAAALRAERDAQSKREDAERTAASLRAKLDRL